MGRLPTAAVAARAGWPTLISWAAQSQLIAGRRTRQLLAPWRPERGNRPTNIIEYWMAITVQAITLALDYFHCCCFFVVCILHRMLLHELLLVAGFQLRKIYPIFAVLFHFLYTNPCNWSFINLCGRHSASNYNARLVGYNVSCSNAYIEESSAIFVLMCVFLAPHFWAAKLHR